MQRFPGEQPLSQFRPPTRGSLFLELFDIDQIVLAALEHLKLELIQQLFRLPGLLIQADQFLAVTGDQAGPFPVQFFALPEQRRRLAVLLSLQ